MAVLVCLLACMRTLNHRRAALKSLAAVGVARALPACTGSIPVHAIVNPDRVDGSARAFALMRGALDDRIVIGNVFGSYHGVVGTVVKPLFGLIGATFSRYRPMPEGGLAIVSFEQAYYTTLDGSRVIEELHNPYTGAAVRVPVWVGEPIIQIVSADLQIRSARPLPPSVSVSQSATRFEAGSDEVVFVERLSVDLPRVAGGRDGYNEIVTLRAPLGAVLASGAVHVGCRTSFSSILSWREWLGMGDRLGHLMAHGAGGYGLEATTLPKLFIEETRRRRPEALADPASILAPGLRELDNLLAKR